MTTTTDGGFRVSMGDIESYGGIEIYITWYGKSEKLNGSCACGKIRKDLDY